MKILNLYAGIGGNRKLWGDEHEVVAVENNEEIAEAYKTFYPMDQVIVDDAHQFLLDNFKEFDFIWSSPPCQTHSKTNWFLHGQGIIRYPDMSLYEEIIFLIQWGKNIKWVVENVVGYYTPLIQARQLGRHLFWSNFVIKDLDIDYVEIGTMNRQASKEAQKNAIKNEVIIPNFYSLQDLKQFKFKNKRQVLRNCVYPEVGKHVLECAINETVRDN